MKTINTIERGAMRFYEHGNARVFETEDDSYFFFEHAELGDEGFCGGVWTKGRTIMDYDGVYNMPRDVEAILQALGYDWVDESFLDSANSKDYIS